MHIKHHPMVESYISGCWLQVFTRLKAANDLSLAAFVAGIKSNNSPRVQTLLKSNFPGPSRDLRKVTTLFTIFFLTFFFPTCCPHKHSLDRRCFLTNVVAIETETYLQSKTVLRLQSTWFDISIFTFQ